VHWPFDLGDPNVSVSIGCIVVYSSGAVVLVWGCGRLGGKIDGLARLERILTGEFAWLVRRGQGKLEEALLIGGLVGPAAWLPSLPSCSPNRQGKLPWRILT
jgi:hypothetical protein